VESIIGLSDIKLVLDFVPNHSSDESEWFQKSVKRIEPYTDFYVWHDGKIDPETGKRVEPNNWVSFCLMAQNFCLN
jgi:alpha-glucosidase